MCNKPTPKLGCYIIHLERAVARLPQVEYLLSRLPLAAKVMNAVDEKSLTREQLRAYQPLMVRPVYPFRLNRAEIAVFHSHRACWRQLLNDGYDAALIVEDDINLSEPEFAAAFELSLQHLSPGDFVRFPVKLRDKAGKPIARSGATCLTEPRMIGLGMVAQIVTRDAAQALLGKTERFDRPVDTFMQMRWHHQIRTLAVAPSGIAEISDRLGGSLIKRRYCLAARCHREILRPIYRLGIALWSRWATQP